MQLSFHLDGRWQSAFRSRAHIVCGDDPMETKMENRKKAMVALAVIAAVALCSAGVLMMSDDVEADTSSTVTAEGDNGTEDLCAIAFVTVTIAAFTAMCVMLFWKKEE